MSIKVYLAPMAGVTDLSFRLISREFGAKHCFFEMLDSMATIYEHPQNKRLLRTVKKDSPISAQLVGTDHVIMLEAAQKILSTQKLTSLDINCGCPARKIIKKGAGAALLKEGVLLGKIVKNLASNLKIPITVKLRTGFYKRDPKELIRIVKICEANGARAIAIHGRTVVQSYKGDIDYESIKLAKAALKIPVFGSGNIFDHLMAKKMVDETGCDGILVARGACGNPWIFKNIENYLKKGAEPKEISLKIKKKVLKKHLKLMDKYKDVSSKNKPSIMGKIAMWYLKGIYSARRLRDQLHRVKSYERLIELIDGAE